jgi:phytoene desaturase
MSKIAVIGSGFSGLSAAAHLAASGHDVQVFEKNESLGGRARVIRTNGYTFDMGPSWYWMPDVFDRFFESFGKKTSHYYDLQRLDPSYRVCFGVNDFVDMPANFEELKAVFEGIEPGSGAKLESFLKEAQTKYEVGMRDLVYKPSLSLFEFVDRKILANIFKIDILKSFSKHISTFFTNPKLKSIVEFPVLFLGARPEDTPALYSLMNYADMKLGTWYPQGGMGKIIDGMVSIAKELGVEFHVNSNVEQINVAASGKATSLTVNQENIAFDIIVSSADYHHTEQKLLHEKYRNYSQKYWETRTMAPSSLIYYIGLNKKLKNLLHHNLFFDQDFGAHAVEIYSKPSWPSNPLFYVSCPSQTDETVAPEGKENLFILIPVASGLVDSEEIKETYFKTIVTRLENLIGETILEHVEYKKSYAFKDFVSDYNSFKGNAYGLANTLKQTAILKPSIKNKKVSNLFYTGQLTVPGPGIPPCLISGEIVAKQINKEYN